MAEYRSRNAKKHKYRPILGVLLALLIVGVSSAAMLLGAWIAFEIGTR